MPKLPQRRPGKAAPTGRKIPWQLLWGAAVWIYTQGRERYEKNLTRSEQAELRQLMLKSRGRASKLTPAQRRRLGQLVRKGATGS